MRIIILLLPVWLFAYKTSDKVYDCTKIFEARKNELIVELDRLDEQRQSLEALKVATQALLKKREEQVRLKENNVSATLEQITREKEAIETLLKQNETVLQTIKEIKQDALSQSFAKMKAGAAASILSDMNASKAASILQTLQPKNISKILAKMSPDKASAITLKLAP